MKKLCFEADSHAYDVGQTKPKGDDIFYRCTECRTILPSNPNRPVRCECRNINLDPEMFKIGVRDYKKSAVLRLVDS